MRVMAESFTFITRSPEETISLGERLGRAAQPSDLVTLSGDLGAGKTHFTKGIAEGVEVKRVVNSPTFTIIKEYKGRLPLYHMDVYRLEEQGGEDLGFEEYFEGEGLTVVEWAEIIKEQLPDHFLDIIIRRDSDTQRTFTFTPYGERYIQLSKELQGK